MTRALWCAAVVSIAPPLTATATATPKVFKYDQFSEDLATAATEIEGLALSTQAGYVAQEAFGQIYRPDPSDYPIKIEGVDLVLAAAPNAPEEATHVWLEIWSSTAGGPDPGAGNLIFAMSSEDLYNISEETMGAPLRGGEAVSIRFDWTDHEGHPPLINEGNIWLMVRFTEPAAGRETEWDNASCAFVAGSQCGCQKIGSLHDVAITSGANVLHHTLGGCYADPAMWSYMEAAGIAGDLVLRLVTELECTPACDGLDCGSDGCGGSCGMCAGSAVCEAGSCACEPDCSDATCGTDGCGGSCGECSEPFWCHDGACICFPTCDGAECGDNGCGGICGECGDTETCVSGSCAEPEPDRDIMLVGGCAALGPHPALILIGVWLAWRARRTGRRTAKQP